MALDQALELTEQLVPGGLQSTLLEPGALQKQREPLQRELSKQFAAAVDTGLGDQLEAKLASMVVDATIDLVLAEADFLKPPVERLAALEGSQPLIGPHPTNELSPMCLHPTH